MVVIYTGVEELLLLSSRTSLVSFTLRLYRTLRRRRRRRRQHTVNEPDQRMRNDSARVLFWFCSCFLYLSRSHTRLTRLLSIICTAVVHTIPERCPCVLVNT